VYLKPGGETRRAFFMGERNMNEKQLTDVIHQHTNDITALNRKVNEINADLQIVLKDQSKLSQLVEAQIKTNYEISNIKDGLKSTNATIAVINSTLKNIETNLL
jgi:plasmid maintenance system antidote protein VapI